MSLIYSLLAEVRTQVENFMTGGGKHWQSLADGAGGRTALGRAVGEDVIQPLQCLSLDAVKLSSACLCELCSGSFGEGESNFARSHLLNLSNGDYAEQI